MQMDNDTSAIDAIFFRTGVWECVVALIGAPANFLVICMALSLLTRSARRRRGQKTYNQYYVLSMTMADFIFTAVHAPLYGIMYVWMIDYSFTTCRFLYISSHTSTVASSLSLLALNVDKYFAVARPLHHALIISKKVTTSLLAATWIISISWAVLLTCGPLTQMPRPCLVTLNHDIAYYTFAVVFFVLPILFSFVIAIYVALVTGRSLVTREDNSPNSNRAEISPQHSSKEQVLYQRHCNRGRRTTAIDKYKSQAKTLTFVFCTTIWSTVTSIPYRTSFVLHIFKISSVELSMFMFGLMAANALGNPFITLFTQRQYRTRLSKCLSRIRKH